MNDKVEQLIETAIRSQIDYQQCLNTLCGQYVGDLLLDKSIAPKDFLNIISVFNQISVNTMKSLVSILKSKGGNKTVLKELKKSTAKSDKEIKKKVPQALTDTHKEQVKIEIKEKRKPIELETPKTPNLNDIFSLTDYENLPSTFTSTFR